ncbi:hypothetical protein GCM10009828_045820 [Actinoplanes couchii]|uniref:Uncharacterized protein n=1 Tax=Actinoplanes couchii TaxID=403638 RepID=A0ABQ3X734_9ACTN|nr:hypothetical protein Aco03nite_027030 [Actinoplanes couchii]
MFRTGGLIGVGFAADPVTGRDLLLVASHSGLSLIDTVTGDRPARDDEEDVGWPDDEDLTCPGIGPIAGARVRMAGLLGGGLHRRTRDGWAVKVVSPDWPSDRVLLSADDHPWTGNAWWHVFHAEVTELRAAGFSPSGATLVVATTSDVTLWTRSDLGEQ